MSTADDLALAALAYDWPTWARPHQVAPPTSWRSWGIVSGRGWGKTRSCVELVIAEILAGRARRIGFASFNLDESERTLIHGESGLIRCSPPWFKPTVIKGIVCWPNGAIATPYTPEVPAGPRGPEHDLVWCSEVAAWPAASREEFFSNMRLGLRLGLGRMIYDTTPRARNPLVRYLLERAAREPQRHVVVRGSTRENRDNLTDGFVSELEAELGGTQRGSEELDGVFHDDAEGALFQQAWIDRARRDMPTTLRRRIVSVDPAISTRKGTDATGVIVAGLGIDDQVYILEDRTERMAAEVWGALVVDLYVRGACDCVLVERNRGADLVVANLRACARERGLRVEVVDANAPTRHTAGTILVKETHTHKSKQLRAEPVASLVESGRVSFVRGVNLTELEEEMCTWMPEGSGESPNRLDAMVYAVSELGSLSREPRPDGSAAIRGAAKMHEALQAAPARRGVNVATLLGGGKRGDRI